MKANDERLPVSFWAKVHAAENGCWLWIASKRRRGYGRFGPKGDQRAAHRVAYEALVGPIPDGLQLDHLCREPSCVNPAHLEPVTQLENIRRGLAARAAAGVKVRKPSLRRTHCKNGHEFTPENTYWNPRDESQVCRTCQRETWKRSYRKRQGYYPHMVG